MKLIKPLAVAALALTATLGLVSPASADPTATTFSLTGGTLSLSVQATATLTGEATGVDANTITGTLGVVTVTDARGGTAGWTTSAISTMFTGTGLSTSTDVQYTNGIITETGTNTVAGVTNGSLVGALPVATATAVSGDNTASWNPTLNVFMPAGSLAGSYTGTVTTSIL